MARAHRLLLLDTASLYFRAFYGLPDSLRAPDGRAVNAVRGLLDFTATFISQYRPTHLACCWDNDWRPQWRVDLIPTYKTHRVVESPAPSQAGSLAEQAPDELSEQVPLIVATLNALGLPIVGVDGFEADDVIATLATVAATTADLAVDIVTGDRDLFQLVDDDAAIRVLYVGRGVSKHERIDQAWIGHKYTISPSQYVEFAVLRGDPSDGLPGVAGIGEKTAAGLLNQFGDLATVREQARAGGLAPGMRAKLLAASDYLDSAVDVVSAVRDVDLGLQVSELGLVSEPADSSRWAELVDELGLGSSAERIVNALALGSH